MSMSTRVIWVLLGIVLLAAGISFYLWDIPAPSTEVHKTFTYDQLNQRPVKPHDTQ